MNLDGSGVVRLTSGTADDTSPAFSPNSDRIAFASTREGSRAVFLMDGNGANPVRVSPIGPYEAYNHPAFSPDGLRLAYDGEYTGLYLSNLDGTGFTRISDGLQLATHPSWGP